MTNEEAMNYITVYIETGGISNLPTVLRNAIYVMRDALEKQIPKKLISSHGIYKQVRGDLYPLQCPTCNCGFTEDATYEHCPLCGQALDWSV